MPKFSRREIVKGSLALGAMGYTRKSSLLMAETSGEVINLNSNSGVEVPLKGRSFLKFSFDLPEPSADFGGFQFSFHITTYENVYSMDPKRIQVTQFATGCDVSCDGLSWAGGQVKQVGTLDAKIRMTDGAIVISASANIPKSRIKSLTTVVRWIPRGEVSVASDKFNDPKDDEILHSWPDLMGNMPSPIVVTRAADKYTSISLSANPQTVRNTRISLRPGEQGYRAEMIYEREAWAPASTIETADWTIRQGHSHEEVARPHYEHVERAFGLQSWESRPDVPQWMRKVSLVVSLHGTHWSGYIFNDYARQLEILTWIAQQISPERVMVFLPAWDGRYYWNYPAYKTDERMGGDEGFRKLITGAQRMGFHLIPMFGSNVANFETPGVSQLRDAVTVKPDGDLWHESYVDWDNDRRTEANYGFMNLGVESWRSFLSGRIAETIDKFGVDGYFLDIVGVCENNRQGDMHLGTKALVDGLRQRFPDKLCVGEMHYDALLASIPVFQADRTTAYSAAVYKYGRMFEHLSWPAPGRGSTGVHEFGFSPRFELPKIDQNVIPTLTIVDDTFDKHREVMKQVIAIGKQWVGYKS